MTGSNQADNAALAVAMLRHQNAVTVPESAFSAAMEWTRGPARMQLLGPGPLTELLPDGSMVWLDGGHNPDAGAAIAKAIENGPAVHVIMGMLKNKDAIGFLKPFAHKIASLHAVPITGHEHHEPRDLADLVKTCLSVPLAGTRDNAAVALARLADGSNPLNVLICGSLYLAGEVLRANDQIPD